MRQGRKLSIPRTASDWDIASLGIVHFLLIWTEGQIALASILVSAAAARSP
jgi:hypothetical protein